MGLKCPHCSKDLVIQLHAAPPMQASKAAASGTAPGALEELLAAIGEQDFADLDDMSRKFVDETQARFEKYGARTMMSDKQLAWLRKIAEGGGRKEPF